MCAGNSASSSSTVSFNVSTVHAMAMITPDVVSAGGLRHAPLAFNPPQPGDGEVPTRERQGHHPPLRILAEAVRRSRRAATGRRILYGLGTRVRTQPLPEKALRLNCRRHSTRPEFEPRTRPHSQSTTASDQARPTAVYQIGSRPVRFPVNPVRVWRVPPRRGRLHVTGDSPHMPTTARSTSRDKVRAHRARLRRAGLRPVQIWVPDVRSKSFARAAHRQSLAVAKSSHARSDQQFVDAISAWNTE